MWYKNYSLHVVILLLIVLLFLYYKAIIHDNNTIEERKSIRELHRSEDTSRYNHAITQMLESVVETNSIQDYYNIPAYRRAEIREVVERMEEDKEKTELRLHKIINGSRDGMIIGFLGGAIIGGTNAAISGAFTWAIIKGVMVGVGDFI
jgi:uncharacterized membrane protein